MSSVFAALEIEKAIRRSPHLTGSSRIVNSKNFPPQPVRPQRQLVVPRKDLALRGRHLTVPQITYSMDRRGYLPANLSELMQFLEDEPWDGYTEIVALGQTGRDIELGKPVDYVPYLYGTGGFHHVGAKSIAETWSDIHSFLVVQR